MTNYYLDTSALARRYLNEMGTSWVGNLCAPAAQNVILICDLTPVEFFSLLARRQREGSITLADAAILQSRFFS